VNAAQQSNAEVLNNAEGLTKFVQLLDSVGVSPSLGKVIFAPVNEAWEALAREEPVLWERYSTQPEFIIHLKHFVNYHFAVEEELTTGQIWDGTRDVIRNEYGNMTIVQNPASIDGLPRSAISSADINTTDGMVNIVGQVIWPPYLRDGIVNQIFDDRSWKFAYTTMANLILHVGIEDAIDADFPNGITVLVPPNRRFNRGELDIPKMLTVAEFENTKDFIKCHMIKYIHTSQSLYGREEEQGLFVTVLGTHIWWATTENQIRFQSEKTLILDNPSRHGLFHVIDMPLKPPSIRHFTDLTWKSTDQDTSDCMKFFTNTNTYSMQLSMERGEKLTMFCPTREAFSAFNNLDFGRLLEPMWIRHAKEFLLNMISIGKHSRAELVARAPSTITFLNNKTYDLRRTGDAPRIKNGINEQARSWFGDLIATDGFLHLTDRVITPTAVSRSVYDQTADDPNFQLVTENIDYVDMQDFIDRDPVLTFMAPYDRAWWRIRFGAMEGVEIIKRHLFRGLEFCDVIANKTSIVAVNGESHKIELHGANEEHVYVAGAYIFKCDILARNGVLHHIDRVIGMEYPTVPPSSSPAPTKSPQPTVSMQPSRNPAGPPPTVSAAQINYQTGYVRPTADAPAFDPNRYTSGAVTKTSLASSLLLMFATALYHF